MGDNPQRWGLFPTTHLDANPPEGATEEEREARADSARRTILAAQKVTAREVLDFAERLGGEAGEMEVLWRQITHRYDSARIAKLDEETEARSEPEGKLGAEARAGATGSSAEPGADSLERRPGIFRRDKIVFLIENIPYGNPYDSPASNRSWNPSYSCQCEGTSTFFHFLSSKCIL